LHTGTRAWTWRGLVVRWFHDRRYCALPLCPSYRGDMRHGESSLTMRPSDNASRYLTFLQWTKSYDGTTLTSDLLAAVIVTIMLIPQSLAYAMLAGLPPEVGLYASILPLVAYAIFGTSRTLAVGPVAVVSLMTASAVGQIAAEGTL